MTRIISGLVLAFLLTIGVSVAAASRPASQAPSLTDQELRYLGAINSLSSMMNASLDAADKLTSVPRAGDVDWRNDFLGETAVWRAVATEISRLDSPSERFSLVHQTMIDGFALYDVGAVQMRASIESFDPAQMTVAVTSLQQGAAKVSDAIDMMTDIQD